MFISIFSLIILAVTALARGEHVNLPTLLQPMGRAVAAVQSYQMVSESSMSAGPGHSVGPAFREEITFVRHGKDVRIRTLVLFSSNYYETVTRGTRSCQRRGPTARWQCQTAPKLLPAASRTPYEILGTALHWRRAGVAAIFGRQAVAYRATSAGQNGGVDHETLWLAATTELPLQCDENAPDGSSVAHVTWSCWNDPRLIVPRV